MTKIFDQKVLMVVRIYHHAKVQAIPPLRSPEITVKFDMRDVLEVHDAQT